MIKLSSGFMMLARDSIRLLNVTRGGSAALFNKSSVWNPISNNFMVASFSSSNSLSITKEWTQTLTRAEKVVGYPTSILNLRYMVMDEMANFANLFRKMMKTKHPLVSLVHDLLLNGVENESKRTLQINGIIVLLIAKAAGIPSGNSNLLQSDISEGILNSQRSLAEITEMIYIGSLIHRGIVNLAATGESMEYKQMDQGNKLAVLCGDYLLASACNNLSKLKNPQVVGLISEVIADISQSKFSHDHEESKTAFLKQWYEKINSTTSILLSNSAKSALLLVSHSPKLQETAWHFAKHLNLAHKVWSDLVDLKHENKLENDHQETILYAIYKDRYSSGQQDVKKVLMSSTTTSTATTVDSSTSLDATSQIELINDCKLVFTEHYHLAMSSLKELENEHSEREALGSLRSILNVMKDTI